MCARARAKEESESETETDPQTETEIDGQTESKAIVYAGIMLYECVRAGACDWIH